MEIKNQPAFTLNAKIVFVTKEQLRRHLSHRYFLQKFALKQCESERLLTGKRIYTDRAKDYLAGSIMGQDICSVFKQLNSTGANILGGAKKISRANQFVNICISGGEPSNAASLQHFRRVTQALENFRQRLSIFWGQKDGGTTGLLCDAPNRVVTICHEGDEIIKLEDLKRVYQEVKIADGDEVLFGEEYLPRVE